MNEPEPRDEIERFAGLLRSNAASHAGETRGRLLRAHFLERAEAELGDAPSRNRRWLWMLPAIASAVVIAIWAALPRSLEFELEGAPQNGAYVQAPADHRVLVRFSDRTTVSAEAGSRLRVDETGMREARVVVESGEATVHVVHDAVRQWTFVAGPFEVLVTGTRFTLDWDPADETLEVRLEEGAVQVRGPMASGPVAVRAGQTFHGDARHKSLLVSEPELSPPGPAEPEPEHASRPSPENPEPEGTTRAAPGPSAVRPAPSSAPARWQELITRGEFAKIVAQAQARGIGSCLSGCSADDLRALSDAARYTGKSQLAEQGLLALRQRFGRGAGRDATFLLGRLAEQRGAWSRAQSWYGSYLREAPAGSFAAEALAGNMRAARALRGREAAAPLARDYLRRFPNGVHAATAREILGER